MPFLAPAQSLRRAGSFSTVKQPFTSQRGREMTANITAQHKSTISQWAKAHSQEGRGGRSRQQIGKGGSFAAAAHIWGRTKQKLELHRARYYPQPQLNSTAQVISHFPSWPHAIFSTCWRHCHFKKEMQNCPIDCGNPTLSPTAT